MNKILASLFMALMIVAVAFMAGCTSDSTEKNITPGSQVITYEKSDYMNSCNNFTFKMYKELAGGSDNVFFSPYSISTALGMAYEGAKGKTATEISSVLNLPTDNTTRHDMFKDLQQSINSEQSGYELGTANAYWPRVGLPINPQYESTLQTAYGAHGEALDYTNDPTGSVDTINTWVENRTNDKIKDLISTNDVNENTALILTNAIYFKSNWLYQFDPLATKDQQFTLSDGSTALTPMMKIDDEKVLFNFTQKDGVKMLELQYTGYNLSMYLILPQDNDIASLEDKFDSAMFSSLKQSLEPTYVPILIPKFKFELKYFLKDQLIALGMPTAFSDDADFSGIRDDGTGTKISKVIHQSFIEVNEEGTEAAAATAVIMEDLGIPLEFTADHPFIFLIEHKETGQILFMGKVENPGA